MKQDLRLWYRQSAAGLSEALPLGNGKLAAWVYGGSNLETVQIDDSTFWSGGPSENNNRKDTRALLPALRQLLREGKIAQADKLGHDFVGNKNNYGTHMPFGNLIIRHERLKQVDSLRRELNLETGIAKTEFASDGVRWKRECFVSHPAKVLALRYAAENGQPFDAAVEFTGIDNDVHTEGLDGSDLLIRGHAWETLHSDGRTGCRAFGRVRILTDGVLRQKSAWARVEGATWLELLAVTETDMLSADPDAECKASLDRAEAQGYPTLRRAHIADFSEKMGRVSLRLEGDSKDDLPTDRRIEAYGQNSGGDTALDTLLFQYGRYVLVSASREDSPLPTHMGGIWNDNIYNKQDSAQDMHIDINVEMQYWPAFSCALPESANALDNWLRDTVVPSGKKTAMEVYGARGWTAHITANPWGFTSLGWAYNWGSFSLGGVWCATLLWDRFEYTQDVSYLQTVWPILRGCAEFIVDYVFFDETSGYYMTGPSYSPENHFLFEGGRYVLSLSTTCDILLVREMLRIVKKAIARLGVSETELLAGIDKVIPLLPPYQIGKHGQVQEWFRDFDEAIPNHRHASHLLGLYPFHQITPESTPDLAKAALVSMQRRYENFEVTSWGFAQHMGMYARLYLGDEAMRVLADDVRLLAKPNLTLVMPEDVDMWGGTWEIDGNTGLTAAMGELLAQSRHAADADRYDIHLLPSLPAAWPDGELRGYRLRGGYTVSIVWQNGRLQSAEILSAARIPFTLLVHGEARSCTEVENNTYRVT